MNLDEIPTPESDVVWSEYLKSNYCTKDVERLRKLHCDLERRLTVARETLIMIADESSNLAHAERMADRALKQTAPKP